MIKCWKKWRLTGLNFNIWRTAKQYFLETVKHTFLLEVAGWWKYNIGWIPDGAPFSRSFAETKTLKTPLTREQWYPWLYTVLWRSSLIIFVYVVPVHVLLWRQRGITLCTVLYVEKYCTWILWDFRPGKGNIWENFRLYKGNIIPSRKSVVSDIPAGEGKTAKSFFYCVC
jgi:hypothetical protein